MAFNSIFISYSHRDEAWKNKLLTYFKEHPEQEEIEIWEDRQIKAGDLWYNQIHQAIDRSAIALLLISPHFLDSHFIQSEEIPKLLQQKAEVGLKIIPIIIQDCAWKDFDWIEKAQARPLDGKALTSFSEDLQNSILSQFVNETLDLKKEHFQRFKQKLTAYLNTVVAEAEKTPAYFPPESKLTNIRVKVKVSPKGVLASQQEAQYREKIFQQAPSSSSIYKYRMDGMGLQSNLPFGSRKNDEERVLFWDKEISSKLQRGVIVGDPGFGKSWLLRWEALKFANQALNKIHSEENWEDLVIPIRLRLSELANALTTEHLIPNAIVLLLKKMNLLSEQAEPANTLDAELLHFIQTRIGSKQILLLLDALDEVPSKNNLKKNLLSRLGTWVEASPQARVWITSRHANYQAPWAIRQNDREREVELLPFDDDQITAFIEAWFGQEKDLAEKMRQLIRENPQLRGLAELPLLLGFICLLYRDEASRSHQPTSKPLSIAQRSRSKIYEEIVKKLLHKEWHHDHSEVMEGEEPQKKTFILFQAQELLEELAFRLFLEDKVQFSQKTLVKLLKEIVTSHNDLEGSATKTKNEDILRLIKELSQERGLLIEGGNTSGSNLQYLFLHLTIQEYLCASFLARTINSEGWANAKLLNTGQLIEDLINKKSWDSRWEQILLLLSSILKDPFPLINLLKDSRIDDVFKHRQALALHCLGEIWLEPKLIGNPIRLHQLETIRNQIGEDVISTWHRYEDRKSVALIPHLRTAIPVLIRIKGQYKKKPALSHLFSILQSSTSTGIKKASINLIQKAKYELISSPEYMQIFMGVFSEGQEDTREALLEILEEVSLELFQTTYFSRILTQFIAEAKPEPLVLIMNIVLQAVEHVKGILNQVHELKEEYLNQPSTNLRKQIAKLIDQASPVFLFFLISAKLNKKSDEPLDVLDSMQYILDRQKAILTPPVFNSFAFEPADQEALDLVLEAISIQNSLEIRFEDEEAFLKSLEEIEIGDLKLKDLVKICNDELGQLVEDEEMRKVFWYMLAKMLKKGGLSGLLQNRKKPETLTEHMPAMINAMNKILEGEHLPLKSIVLEGIVDMYQEKDQYVFPGNVAIELDEAFENVKNTIRSLITHEENPELVKELTLANLRMLDFANEIQQYILVFQELSEAGELEEQYDPMRNLLSKLMRRLWKENSFIIAYCDAFVNMDPQGISTEEEFQQALWTYPPLIDTILDIYHTSTDSLVKADIIQILKTQREGYYRYNELMDCLEECLLSNEQELQFVCLEILANVGHEIALRPKIFQFLCRAITQKKNIKLATEATKAVREVTRANPDVLDQWKDELLQLTQILLQTFLWTKNNDLRLSAALSLYQLSESRSRFFFKEPETWAGKLLSGIRPKKYEIKSIKSLTGIEL